MAKPRKPLSLYPGAIAPTAPGRVACEVFELLAGVATPLTAYELLWRLQDKRGRATPPSTIYRALKLLTERHLVHRVSSLGAYVVCAAPAAPHEPAFLVCEKCHGVSEIDAAATRRRLETQIAAAGFAIKTLNCDAYGLCAGCR